MQAFNERENSAVLKTEDNVGQTSVSAAGVAEPNHRYKLRLHVQDASEWWDQYENSDGGNENHFALKHKQIGLHSLMSEPIITTDENSSPPPI